MCYVGFYRSSNGFWISIVFASTALWLRLMSAWRSIEIGSSAGCPAFGVRGGEHQSSFNSFVGVCRLCFAWNSKSQFYEALVGVCLPWHDKYLEGYQWVFAICRSFHWKRPKNYIQVDSIPKIDGWLRGWSVAFNIPVFFLWIPTIATTTAKTTFKFRCRNRFPNYILASLFHCFVSP